MTEIALDQNQTLPCINLCDPLLELLDQQLRTINSSSPPSLTVCKWPVILTSSVFVIMLSWEMAGDQGGWFRALWVPSVGVIMVVTIWLWDQFLISGRTFKHWLGSCDFRMCSSWGTSHHFTLAAVPAVPAVQTTTDSSLEFVHSSFHQLQPSASR
jgi:hypothetical protein